MSYNIHKAYSIMLYYFTNRYLFLNIIIHILYKIYYILHKYIIDIIFKRTLCVCIYFKYHNCLVTIRVLV